MPPRGQRVPLAVPGDVSVHGRVIDVALGSITVDVHIGHGRLLGRDPEHRAADDYADLLAPPDLLTCTATAQSA